MGGWTAVGGCGAGRRRAWEGAVLPEQLCCLPAFPQRQPREPARLPASAPAALALPSPPSISHHCPRFFSSHAGDREAVWPLRRPACAAVPHAPPHLYCPAQAAGEGFGSFDILTDEAVRQGLKELSNWPTYPQARRRLPAAGCWASGAGRRALGAAAAAVGTLTPCRAAAPLALAPARPCPCRAARTHQHPSAHLPNHPTASPNQTGVRQGRAAGRLRHRAGDGGGGGAQGDDRRDEGAHVRRPTRQLARGGTAKASKSCRAGTPWRPPSALLVRVPACMLVT